MTMNEKTTNEQDSDRPITLQEFSTAVTIWSKSREYINDPTYDWRIWITALLREDYQPIEGTLFGEAILDLRARNQKAKKVWGV